MKGLVCKMCGHVALSGAAPEKCPVCGAPQKSFQQADDAVKEPADRAKLADAEKKHTPDIKVVKECGLIPGQCTDVHVRVGIDLVHPMTPEHFIGWLDFYLNKAFITRVMLTSKVNPGGGIHLKKDSAGTLSVIEWCNQHGRWMNEVKI